MSIPEEDYSVLLYGSLRTLIVNKKYYKNSAYSYEKPCLTEAGEHAVIELLNMFAPRILSAIREADEQRSKQIVMSELKGT